MGQLIDFPFGTGIDQRTRPEYVDGSQRWVSLVNVRARKTSSADKRFGFEVFDDGSRTLTGTRTAGVRIISDGITPTVFDGTYVDSYAIGRSISRSRVPEATFTTQDLPTVGFNGSVDDITYVNGYLVAVYTSGSTDTVSYVVIDATTGAIVFGPATAGTGVGSVVSYSTYAVIVLADVATPQITYGYINTLTPVTISSGFNSFGGDLTAGAWAPSDKAYSVTQYTDRVAIAYNIASGTDRVVLKTFDITSGVLETATINTASTQPKGVDIDIGPAGDTLWVAYSQGTAVKVVGYNPASLASVLATSATMITATSTNNYPKIAGGSTAGKARVLTLDTGTYRNTRIAGVTTSGGAATLDGTAQRVPGVIPLGRPFCKSDRYYVLSQAGLGNNYGSTSSTSAVLVDYTDDATFVRPVCNVEPNLAVLPNGALEGTGLRGKAITTSDTNVRYLTLNVRKSSAANAATLVRVDFANMDRWQPATFNNSTYLSGGVLGYIDGRSFIEAGFLNRPVKPTTSTSGTGVTFSTGVRYAVTFESVDADGNWTISGVSDPSDALTCSNKTVTITSQPYAVTYRQSSSSNVLSTTRVSFWRTTDNGGTPPYYRVATVDNNTANETVTTADTTTDANLVSAAKLYSQPGITGTAQDRRAPPGLGQIQVLNGMLCGAQGRNVWYSGQPVIGEAAWFNPIFQVPIDGEGDITALAVQDGTLFVFKRTGIWAITGDPPSDNAASGGLGAPRRLAVDVGCISQRSVVTTSLGTFFQSERGIELLSRSQSVEWIGEWVQDESASFPVVTQATIDSKANLVYFELASATSNGRVSGTGEAAVFDLSLKVWISIDRRAKSDGTANTPAQSACMLYDGSDWAYAWLDADGVVYRETSQYIDPSSSWITKQADGAWAKLTGVQGRMRFETVKLLAKYATDSDQAIALAYDYETGFRSATTYTRAAIAALASGAGGAGTMPNVHLEHYGHEDASDTMAVRVRVADATPTGGTVGTGQGALWTGLTFEVTPMEGGYQLPDGAG